MISPKHDELVERLENELYWAISPQYPEGRKLVRKAADELTRLRERETTQAQDKLRDA